MRLSLEILYEYDISEGHLPTCLFGNVASTVVQPVERYLHQFSRVLRVDNGDGDGGQLRAPVPRGNLRGSVSWW